MNNSVLDFLPYSADRAISRERLVQMTGLTDRAVRQELQDLKIMFPVVHCENGYYIACKSDDVNLKAYVRQEKARALSILKGIKVHKRLINNEGQLEFDFGE